MKLSKYTIEVLKNFSRINQSILFKDGNKLRTISVMKNILAEAVLPEEFPKEFGIYDLQQFINGIELHDNPDLDFSSDNYVIIHENKNKTKYFYSDPNVIVTPPEKSLSLPSEDVCFEISSQQLSHLLKASGVYGLPDLSAIGNGEIVKLVVRDKKNDTSNVFSIDVGLTTNVFTFNFKIENIKILPGSYEVVISKKFLSKFSNKDKELIYWIALEPDSIFENS